jgi:hypothetical protein
VAAIASAVTLLGAACSDASPEADSTAPVESTMDNSAPADPAADGSPDPCQLLTLEEISAVFGADWAHSEELPASGLPGQRTCWFAPAAGEVTNLSVVIFPFEAAALPGFKGQLSGVTDFEGLGDAAFGQDYAFWVLKGSYMLNLSSAFNDQGTVGNLRTLAETAVGRMP